MNLKYVIFVSILALALGQDAFSTVSKARQERGASCTDNCTKDGKFYTSDLELAGFGKSQIGITTNIDTLKEKVDFVNRLCKNLSPSEEANPQYAGNVNWCDKNCTKKGGVLSKLKGRQEKVIAFVSERKQHCNQTMSLYAQVFHQALTHDLKQNALVLKSESKETPPPPSYNPPPPFKSN
jgi:putative hemolysin